jgi:hypothetical protein
MTLQDACLSGLAGAAAVEVAELYLATRRVNDFPWRKKGEATLSVYLFSVVLRLGLGVFAAWFCAQTGPVDVAGAVAAGVAAPKLLEQLGRFPAETAQPPALAAEAVGTAAAMSVEAVAASVEGKAAEAADGGPSVAT